MSDGPKKIDEGFFDFRKLAGKPHPATERWSGDSETPDPKPIDYRGGRPNHCGGALLEDAEKGTRTRVHCTAQAELGYGLCRDCSGREAEMRQAFRAKAAKPSETRVAAARNGYTR